ncbi:MAG: TraX family protein [Eubacteriales bacterium]|nr:TraX family protein [Eubacteriales bacterium]
MANTLQFKTRKFRGLSGNQLKMIAFFLMLFDSIGFMLIMNGRLYGLNPEYWMMAISSPEGSKWYLIARIMRFVGRLAFPIFAYFIVEGYINTQSVSKYIIRMGLFAVISEVPFDLACFGTYFYPGYQNVLFTYFISLIALDCLNKLKNTPAAIVWQVIVAGMFCFIAYSMKSDYNALGVALICVMWMLRHNRKVRHIAGVVISVLESIDYFGISALSFFLLHMYNGDRGHVPLKYFFYIMYPAHMALFYLLVRLATG